MNAELVTPAIWAGALGFAAMAVWNRLAWVRNPRVWGLLALSLATVTVMAHFLSRALGTASVGIEPRTLVGAGLFLGSGALAFRGTRLWARARLLLSGGRRRVDEVLASGERTVDGVFEGRVDADQPVTSPSGIVCAFYRAELRAASPLTNAGRGPLLSIESAHPKALRLSGERGEVRVTFSPSMVMGRPEIRRCQLEMPELSTHVLAEGSVPVDALSYEQLGRVGDRCCVVGRFERDVAGRGRIVGPDGGPALVLVGDGALEAGRGLRRAAAACVSGAVLACVMSAALLAGAL